MNGLYDLALIGEDLLDAKFPHRRANKKETSIGSPSGLTYVPQVMNSLFEMIGPIAQYPFTQVRLLRRSSFDTKKLIGKCSLRRMTRRL